MDKASGNSSRCICSTRNEQDTAASFCTTARHEFDAARTPKTKPIARGGCASLHGCGAPQAFKVPPGVNVEEHDSERTRLVVRQFVDAMMFGVDVRLAVEGVCLLLVTAALDRDRSTLTFSCDGFRKKLPLRLVRRVVVERQEFSPGEDNILWLVCLELEGDQLCTFVFDGPDALREASYLGGCLHVLLVEAAAPDGFPREVADIASLVSKFKDAVTPQQKMQSSRLVGVERRKLQRDATRGTEPEE